VIHAGIIGRDVPVAHHAMGLVRTGTRDVITARSWGRVSPWEHLGANRSLVPQQDRSRRAGGPRGDRG
jgi:hypothetical protein